VNNADTVRVGNIQDNLGALFSNAHPSPFRFSIVRVPNLERSNVFVQ
jgi:hypothetical protein